MSIQILPDEVASQIAAGEVIERPASVVKELIENALDAGATLVRVRAEGAGQRLIEVIDDGSGIAAQELDVAVTRHATSKLRSADDLFRITTLGFRGEALASIGSVSRLTIASRPKESELGAVLRVEGGHIGARQPVGIPIGTQVKVEDLFFNVPARKKFMKSDLTERRQIDDLVTRYALAYPHVRVHLTQEGRPTLQTSGNNDRREILASLYGVEITRQMLEVLSEEDELRLTGFISSTSLTRSNRREINFYVNGRPVQDVALTTALVQSYHTLLMVGRYPMAVMFLDLPPEQVDVNVHPTKAEVRFRERDRIFSMVQRSVRRALLAYTPVPGASSVFNQPTSAWQEPGRWQGAPTWEEDRPTSAQQLPGSTPPEGQSTPLPVQDIPLLRLVGQIAASYLVAEGPDGLYLVDQHAAHERVLFERFMSQRSGETPAQSLLEPVAVDFPPSSVRILEAALPTLQSFGFQVELFGRNTFLVRSVPVLLSGMDPASALRVLVEDFEEDETPLQNQVEAKVIARVCKRAAVRAGMILSTEEQQALLYDLERCSSPRTCPHGRPTMIHLSVDLLERQFGRKGAR